MTNCNLDALDRSNCFLEKEGNIFLLVLANNVNNFRFTTPN